MSTTMDDRTRAELYDLALREGIDPETLYAAWQCGDAEELLERLDAVEHAARAHLAADDALTLARRTDAADVPAAEARADAARECLAGLVGYVAREGGR